MNTLRILAAGSLLSAIALSADLGGDALADLGLDIGSDVGTTTGPETEPATVAADTSKPKVDRTPVEIGELEFGTADFIPAMKRGGASGSKYEFEKLVEPVPFVREDGTEGFKYATFIVGLLPNVEADKLRRSVQSATTAENRKHKLDGTVNRYITRSHIKNGEFAGVIVFRVDGTVAEEAE